MKLPTPPQVRDTEREPNAGRLSIWHDLYVDHLGSLVPGLLTVILGSAALFSALSTVHVALFQQPLAPGVLPGGLTDVIGSLHWEIATIIVVSSYVIGAVFFRQDPKRPDAISALHVWMRSKRGERHGLAVQATENLPPELELQCEDEKPGPRELLRSYFLVRRYTKVLGLDTQFPYLHLRCYLAARGLTELIPFIPWCPDEKESRGFRTKMFINMLKIRLLSLFPQMSRDIIRNEAHVRLATSVWYASTSLLYLACAVLAVLLCCSASCIRNEMAPALFVSSSFTILLMLFCIAMRYHLRKCVHYMRVREVIYVLETARLAEQISGTPLFGGLSNKSESGKCAKCDRMKPAQPASSGA
jgi:hypothetical protein